MPRGRSPGPSIKNPRQYEKMRSSGMSKHKAARISNAGKGALRKGGKQPSYDDWTKDDLMKRARDLDISGRSSMNKGQLIKALRSSR
ncbi:MAG TPA: Rho termination factor [Acidimicrobiales bacterium]|nr:Rho termination factor [Acidimicrobiales bacterium]